MSLYLAKYHFIIKVDRVEINAEIPNMGVRGRPVFWLALSAGFKCMNINKVMLSKSCLSSFVRFCSVCHEIPFLFPKTFSGKAGLDPKLTDVLQADLAVHFLLVAKRRGFFGS